MIPTARTNAGCIAQTALHFIGDRGRQNHLFPVGPEAFTDGQNRGEVIARMSRLFREIGVVVVEITDATTGRESGPIRRRLVISPDDGRAIFSGKIGGNLTGDPAGIFVPCSQRAAEGIKQAPFDLVDDIFPKVFER